MLDPRRTRRSTARVVAAGSVAATALAGLLVAAPSATAVIDPPWPTSLDQFATQAGISTWCEAGHVGAAVYYTMKAGTPWSLGDGSMYVGAEYDEILPVDGGDPVGYGIGDLAYPEGAPELWYMNDFGWDYYMIKEGDEVVIHYGDVAVSEVLDCSAPSAVFRFWSPKFNNAHFFTTDLNEAMAIIESDANWTYEGAAFDAAPTTGGTCSSGEPVYRFYSPTFLSHFYTQSAEEKDHIIAVDHNWNYEGVAYCASATEIPGTTALYRFWSPGFGKHFFTADAAEAAHIRAVDRNWIYEKVAYYVWPAIGG